MKLVEKILQVSNVSIFALRESTTSATSCPSCQSSHIYLVLFISFNFLSSKVVKTRLFSLEKIDIFRNTLTSLTLSEQQHIFGIGEVANLPLLEDLSLTQGHIESIDGIQSYFYSSCFCYFFALFFQLEKVAKA
jgi:Leucine-rich repeat (LRR) protein